MKREQVEEREHLSFIRKDRALQKSKGRCCHCGKRITFEYSKKYDSKKSTLHKATLEHFVPISKAGREGSNDIKNLFALCESCNKEKGNFIYNPKDYLKYVSKEYMEEIEEYFNEYIHSVDFLNKNNFMSCDRYLIDFCNIDKRQLNRIKGNRKRKLLDRIKVEVWYKKATYKDMDRLSEVLIKRMSKDGNSDYDYTFVAEELIKLWLDYGAVYYVEDKEGKIVAFTSVSISKIKDDGNKYGYSVSTLSIPRYNSNHSLNMVYSFSRMVPKIIMREQNLVELPADNIYPHTPIPGEAVMYRLTHEDNDEPFKETVEFFKKFGVVDNAEYDMKLRSIMHVIE